MGSTRSLLRLQRQKELSALLSNTIVFMMAVEEIRRTREFCGLARLLARRVLPAFHFPQQDAGAGTQPPGDQHERP